MTGDMNLVATESVLSENLALLGSCELDRRGLIATEGVVQEKVLEALSLSNVIVVGDVDTERARVSRESDNLKRGEIRS